MNETNRGVNRAVLLLTGLALLVGGTGLVLAATRQDTSVLWDGSWSTVISWLRQTEEATRLGRTTVSGLAIAVLAALLVVVMVAVVVLARLGGGRSTVVVREDAIDGVRGAVVIRQGFASDAITRSLSSRTEILMSRVSASTVRGTTVLHVSVTPRRGTSPPEVATTAVGLVDNLAALTGREVPALISIRSGARARLGSDRPRVG